MNLVRPGLAAALACACAGSYAADRVWPDAPDAQAVQVALGEPDQTWAHAARATADPGSVPRPLSPVAEPRPWQMMLAGLVGLGCLVRLKRGAGG
jgi:hypothetical protein